MPVIPENMVRNCLAVLAGLCIPLFAGAVTTPETADATADLSFPDAVRSSNNTYRIPFTWVGRLPAVTAKVDTTVGTFFFDTGAECLLLNSRLFKGQVRVVGSSQYGVTGGNDEVFSRRVDSLNWENFFLENVSARVLSLAHIERARNIPVVGIIGYDVFKDFEVLLDYGARLIVLTRLDKNGYRLDPNVFPDPPIDSLNIELARHGVLIKAQVEGKTLKMHLDSGAEINLLDRLAPKKVLNRFTIIKRVNLLGAGENKVEVLAGTLSGVTINQSVCDTMRTLLTSLDDLSLILGTRVDGVLGYEYLRPRKVLINYKRRKLFLFEPQKP